MDGGGAEWQFVCSRSATTYPSPTCTTQAKPDFSVTFLTHTPTPAAVFWTQASILDFMFSLRDKGKQISGARPRSRTWLKPGLQTQRRRPLACGKPRGGASIAEADGPGYVILKRFSRLREITGAALHLGTSPWERGAPHPPCMMLPP